MVASARTEGATRDGSTIDPAEVARACAYLSSEESGLMTGATINFDQSIWGAYEDSPHPSKPF